MDRATSENPAILIEGHQVTDLELKLFGIVLRSGSISKAAAEAGIDRSRIQKLVDQPWFQKLYEQTGAIANKAFFRRLQELDDKTFAAFEEIVTGVRAKDKSAMAAAKLIELRLKAGKDPILDTKPQTFQIKNEQHNTAVVLTHEQMRGMSAEEIIDLQRTGQLPERLRQALAVPQPPAWEPPRELNPEWRGAKALETAKKVAERSAEIQPVKDDPSQS